MGAIFVAIYDFFARRRVLLWGVLVLTISVLALLASRVKYSEQITGFFRDDQAGQRQAMIFDHLKMMDKIVVMFSASGPENAAGSDSTRLSPQRAIECADDFERRLMGLVGSEGGQGGEAGDEKRGDLITSIVSGVGDGQMTEVVDFVYRNLPATLTDDDYRRLDSLLAPGGVERAVADARNRLTSPLGMALRGILLRDPLRIGTRKLAAMNGFSSLANYEIVDGHIFTRDMSTMMVVVEPRHGIGDTGANEILVSAIEQSARETIAAGFADVRIDYIGGPSVAVHNARQVKADTWLTLSIALIITVIFILTAFRNRLAAVLIVVPVVFGALFALAAIWLTGQHTMSAIAIGAGAAVLGIALSYSIHVVSHANHTADPRQIIRELAYPLTVGGFTTIGAFLGLLFTRSQLLRDFGLFAALTLVGTTIFCLVFLPHFLLWGRRGGQPSAVQRTVERISGHALDRNRWIVWGVAAVTVVCSFFYGRVGFDSDMMNLNYMPPRLSEAEQRLESFAPGNGRPVAMVSTGADFESAYASYSAVEAILDSLQREQLIDGYVSAARFLPPPSLQKERLERWNAFWSTPNALGMDAGADGALSRREATISRVETSAQEAGFRDGAFAEFADLLTREPAVGDWNEAQSAPEGVSGTESVSEVSPLPSFLADWTATAADGTRLLVTNVRVAAENKEQVYARLASQPDLVIVDRAYFAGRMAQGVSNDFNLILTIASVLIFVALLISYGRIELTLMAFLPMVVSWIVILGAMALLGVEFNIVTIILSTFIFGIGDDFSIFIMDGLLAEYRNGKKLLAAHKTAIFFSAFTIVVGLGVLIFARHPAMKSLAGISILGIVTVIVVAWVVQPVLWRLLVTRQTRRGGCPFTLAGVANSAYAFAWFLIGCAVLQLIMVGLWLVPVDRRRKKLWFHRCVRFATRFFLRTMITTRRVTINEGNERFEKPAVIIANHQSFIDILVLLGLHPKLVMVTNSWVWRSPFFGRIVRYAGFFHTAGGHDALVDELRERVAEGYSVVVFPEGTRSEEGQIGRFHKGAFHLAAQLGLDIVPVVLYGNGLVSSKRQPFYIKKGMLVSKILPRMAGRTADGDPLNARQVGMWFREQYRAVYEQFNRAQNPYFFDALIKSHTYKGPVLEWYMRIKVRMERGYDLFDRLIPRDASVVDIGCGYGALAHTLAMLSDRRQVLGIDYDEEKIAVARHSFLTTERTSFIAADALGVELPEANVFILSDVLHYMTHDAQDELLARCFARLHPNPNGMVIIRDGDSDETIRHRATERTERWSTRLVRFNKTVGELHFTNTARITAAATKAGFSVRVVDETSETSNKTQSKTSNKIYVCTMSRS
jgi:1-acyl-sn-glycerol-3-phosphate acyltransferase